MASPSPPVATLMHGGRITAPLRAYVIAVVGALSSACCRRSIWVVDPVGFANLRTLVS